MYTSQQKARHGQQGQIRCFGCGGYGHKRGDACCNASAGAWHECAPDRFKNGGHGQGNSNSGNSGSKTPGKNGGNRNNSKKNICNFYKRNGHCRFGQNCKFKHEGGAGDDTVAVNAIVGQVMNTIQSRLGNMKKSSNSNSKQKRKHSSSADSDSNSSGDSSDDGGYEEPDRLLDLLTAATKPKDSKKARKTKRGRKGKGGGWMTQISLSDQGNVKCLAELHSHGSCGWDTDASRFVTTDAQNMIPSLLDRSDRAVKGISFDSAAGTTSVLGIGPAARATISTEDGKAFWLIEPNAVLLDRTAAGHNMTVYSAQSMKRLGMVLRQCHNGTDQDVIICRRSNRVVRLAEENGILVLETIRRKATDLARIQGIEMLVEDIAAGLVSPLVPCSLKRYVRRGGRGETQLTIKAQLESNSNRQSEN